MKPPPATSAQGSFLWVGSSAATEATRKSGTERACGCGGAAQSSAEAVVAWGITSVAAGSGDSWRSPREHPCGCGDRP